MNYQDYKQFLMDELWEQKPQEISEYQIKTIIKFPIAIQFFIVYNKKKRVSVLDTQSKERLI